MSTIKGKRTKWHFGRNEKGIVLSFTRYIASPFREALKAPFN